MFALRAPELLKLLEHLLEELWGSTGLGLGGYRCKGLGDASGKCPDETSRSEAEVVGKEPTCARSRRDCFRKAGPGE